MKLCIGLLLVTCAMVVTSQVMPAVFWMHIQKTSSWLGNFLLLWGCSNVRKLSSKTKQGMVYVAVGRNMSKLQCEVPFHTGNFGFGYHVPFDKTMNRTAITLFRNPYNRVISSFLYGKGVHQIMFPLGFPDRAKRKFELRKQIRDSEYPILTYVQLPGIASCQAKMTLGRECGEVNAISDEDLVEAVRRVRFDLAFVGLTEESRASAQLFMAMYPVVLSQQEVQADGKVDESALLSAVGTAPRTNADHTHQVNEVLFGVLRDHHWQDKADEVVYRAAVKVFYERCRLYHIETDHSEEEVIAKLPML